MSDVTKISASSNYDSIKNYTVVSSSVSISGSVGAGASVGFTHTVAFTRTEGTIPQVLVNYNGSPNTATDWFLAGTAPRFASATLTGYGDVPIDFQVTYTTTGATIVHSLTNPDVSARALVSITATIQCALSVIVFS